MIRTALDDAAPPPPGRQYGILPRDRALGWTPFAWLIYLPTFVVEPAYAHRPAWEAALTYAATALFLALYFRAYWARGRERVAIVVAIAALAAAFAPINTGSSVLWVYACGFAAQARDGRTAARAIGAITLCGLAVAWALHLPPWYWITVGLFGPIIGGVNLHFAQVGRANRALHLAHQEIAHLAAVAERERIARDLHDLLGHTLSMITLKSELAAKLAERDPARAGREMREVERVSRAALQEVREAIRGYRVTLADELARARSLLATACVSADVDGAPAGLPRAVDETLALAVREAVTNVVRHAGARRCRVRLTAGADVRLEVTDDGRGGAAPEGSGLRGMRDRVEALGGTVARARDGGGRGTALVVTLPNGEPDVHTTLERLVRGVAS